MASPVLTNRETEYAMSKVNKTYTVMVLEDEVLLLRAITTKLEKSGIKVVSCTTGKQALDYLSELPAKLVLP